MRKRDVACACAVLCMVRSIVGAEDLTPAPRARLCVTEGAVGELPGHRLSVNVSKMRAYVEDRTPQDVEARFTYLGATASDSPLGSGEMRRQFGLKLRAQDACNLVYAMWRIEPQSELVVSVKSNPLQHTSAECGNRGYRNIRPSRHQPVPPVHAGDSHTVHAVMSGAEVRVFIDGRLVWEGSVGPEAGSLNGPVGIRSDNARLQIELLAGRPGAGAPASDATCRSEPE